MLEQVQNLGHWSFPVIGSDSESGSTVIDPAIGKPGSWGCGILSGIRVSLEAQSSDIGLDSRAMKTFPVLSFTGMGQVLEFKAQFPFFHISVCMYSVCVEGVLYLSTVCCLGLGER